MLFIINFISILGEHCESKQWRFCTAASDLGLARLPLTHKKSSAAPGLGLHACLSNVPQNAARFTGNHLDGEERMDHPDFIICCFIELKRLKNW